MTLPILSTKLNRPPLRPNTVSRPRLNGVLDEGLRRKLTLVTAPAGYGKTTLVSEWLAGCSLPAAWLSLDEKDQALTRFLTYLCCALQKTGASAEGILNALQTAQALPLEPLLTALLNAAADIPQHAVLVLDDYHAVASKPIDDALVFILASHAINIGVAQTEEADTRGGAIRRS